MRARHEFRPIAGHAIVGLLALLVSGAAGAGEWVSDAADSRLEFVASYTGSDLPGSFSRFVVDMTFDPQQPEAGRLVVTVDITSADMGGDDMNQAVTGAAWLDVAEFASATFTSDAISMPESGAYLAAGTLELKGVRRAVSVPFTWREEGEHASMRGELSLQRLDFGIGTGTWAATDEVAADVRVGFDIVLRRAD